MNEGIARGVLPRPKTQSIDVGLLALFTGLVLFPLYPKIGLASVAGTYIPVRLDDIITGLIAGAWLFQLHREKRWPHIPSVAGVGVAWLVAGLLAVIVGAFLFRLSSPSTALLYWAKPAEYLLLGWIAFDRVRGEDQLRRLLTIVLATAAVVVVYGLLQRLGWAPSPPTYVPGATLGVVTSTFGDPHQLATYLGIVAALAIATVAVPGRRALIAAVLLLVGSGYVIVQTGGRSEFVASIAVGLVLYLWRQWPNHGDPQGDRGRRGLAVLAFVGSLAIALAIPRSLEASIVNAMAGPNQVAQPSGGPESSSGPVASPPPGQSDVGERIGGDLSQDLSLSIRLKDKWPRLIAVGMRSPIFGAGPSAATEAADGYYIRSFVEVGLVGTIAFAALMVALLVALWHTTRTSNSEFLQGAGRGAIVATLFVAVVGILIDTWVASRPMQLYWPVVGAILGGAERGLAGPKINAAMDR